MANDEFIQESQNKVKATWKVIKRELGTAKTLDYITEISDGHISIKNSLDIANKLNAHFTSVAQDLKNTISYDEAVDQVEYEGNQPFCLSLVTECKIEQIIKSLKNSNATGWDEIPTSVIKHACKIIKKPLTYLINLSLQTGVFPDKLKYTNVIPVPKTRGNTETANFRPIVNLSVFSKIYEKCFLDQFCTYLEQRAILKSHQHGYRKGKSTTTAVYDTINTVLRALDGSQESAVLFCDLSKAFDCVNHKLLIKKLQKYRIEGSAIQWVKSFLEDRKQRVVIRNSKSIHNSQWLNVKCGVPQGSSLGPILFILYTNDIKLNVPESRITLFADDTSVVVQAKGEHQLQERLTSTLEQLSHWYTINGLKFNVDKTKLTVFKSRHAGQVLQQVNDVMCSENVKFLGLHVDKGVRWNEHISKLCKKLGTACFSMRIMLPAVDIKTIKSIYYSNFYSHLKYGVVFWGSSSNINRVFKMQKRAIRLIAGVRSRDSCRRLFGQLEIMTLPSLYIYELVIFFRVNHHLMSEYHHAHHYNTRNQELLLYPLHRLTLLENGPFYMGLKVLNKLPTSIKIIESIKTLKSTLKSALIKKSYYSVKEYFDDQNFT